MFKEITTLENEIRNFINTPRYKYNLIRDNKRWNQLCSSLDIIGDTTLAIESYYNGKWPSDTGMQYLLIYGLLQAIFIQQDALKHIAEALDINLELDAELRSIRNLRNDSIGHPTKRRAGEKQTSHFISRMSLHKDGFTLMSSTINDSTIFRNINLISIIEKQIKSVKFLLSQVVKVLKAREKQHKEKYSHMKLMDIFPQTMSYHFSKVFEGIHSKHNKTIGQIDIEYISELYSKLKTELQVRGEYPANEVLVYELDEIDYAIGELIKYFDESKSSKLNDKDANIFAHFVERKHEEIVQILKEIDEEYSS